MFFLKVTFYAIKTTSTTLVKFYYYNILFKNKLLFFSVDELLNTELLRLLFKLYSRLCVLIQFNSTQLQQLQQLIMQTSEYNLSLTNIEIVMKTRIIK